jgi:hypothetical protein
MNRFQNILVVGQSISHELAMHIISRTDSYVNSTSWENAHPGSSDVFKAFNYGRFKEAPVALVGFDDQRPSHVEDGREDFERFKKRSGIFPFSFLKQNTVERMLNPLGGAGEVFHSSGVIFYHGASLISSKSQSDLMDDLQNLSAISTQLSIDVLVSKNDWGEPFEVEFGALTRNGQCETFYGVVGDTIQPNSKSSPKLLPETVRALNALSNPEVCFSAGSELDPIDKDGLEDIIFFLNE